MCRGQIALFGEEHLQAASGRIAGNAATVLPPPPITKRSWIILLLRVSHQWQKFRPRSQGVRLMPCRRRQSVRQAQGRHEGVDIREMADPDRGCTGKLHGIGHQHHAAGILHDGLGHPTS